MDAPPVSGQLPEHQLPVAGEIPATRGARTDPVRHNLLIHDERTDRHDDEHTNYRPHRSVDTRIGQSCPPAAHPLTNCGVRRRDQQE